MQLVIARNMLRHAYQYNTNIDLGAIVLARPGYLRLPRSDVHRNQTKLRVQPSLCPVHAVVQEAAQRLLGNLWRR